jgi:hypothetical protein
MSLSCFVHSLALLDSSIWVPDGMASSASEMVCAVVVSDIAVPWWLKIVFSSPPVHPVAPTRPQSLMTRQREMVACIQAHPPNAPHSDLELLGLPDLAVAGHHPTHQNVYNTGCLLVGDLDNIDKEKLNGGKHCFSPFPGLSVANNFLRMPNHFHCQEMITATARSICFSPLFNLHFAMRSLTEYLQIHNCRRSLLATSVPGHLGGRYSVIFRSGP